MIKVIVVDDSLFMRTLIRDLLNSDPEIEVVDTAKDGMEAVEKIVKIKPDCVTLDLVMRGWDGLTTLKHIMDEHPAPVVILSAYSKRDADITIECLNAGAVGFVLKPSGELSLDIQSIQRELIDKVKAASRVNVPGLKSLVAKKPGRHRRKLTGINKIIVIGASTGGPQTLEVVLSSVPGDFPAPIIVVQHMPSRFFTESLAERLDGVCELTVKLAEHRQVLQERTVYVTPSGSRLTVAPLRRRKKARTSIDAIINITQDEAGVLTPSINITMKSVAKAYNRNTVGIILTGMGDDGLEGMKAVKECGGRTIVQDESSLIFGMPKAVIDAGYADKVLPAGEIVWEIVDMVEDKSRAER